MQMLSLLSRRVKREFKAGKQTLDSSSFVMRPPALLYFIIFAQVAVKRKGATLGAIIPSYIAWY
jgi:hypothetical protein